MFGKKTDYMNQKEKIQEIYKILEQEIFPEFYAELLKERIESKEITDDFIDEILVRMQDEIKLLAEYEK